MEFGAGLSFWGPVHRHRAVGVMSTGHDPQNLVHPLRGMDRHVHKVTSQNHYHHHNHNHHTGVSLRSTVVSACFSGTLTDAMDGERAGAAKRRWDRRLRAWHRHVKLAVAMELATALHHVSKNCCFLFLWHRPRFLLFFFVSCGLVCGKQTLEIWNTSTILPTTLWYFGRLLACGFWWCCVASTWSASACQTGSCC